MNYVKKPGAAGDGSFSKNIQFQKLFENSYDGISLLDKDLNTIYRSRSAMRINGWDNAERAKHSMPELIHPADRDRVSLFLKELLMVPGQTRTFTYQSKHKDGHYIWLECVFSNMLNEPDIEAIVCNFRDISAQKQAEQLHQQTSKELFAYKYALDEAAIVAITDQKGIIKHVNQNFCRISKYSAEELIGQDHRIINSSYHDKDFIRNVWATIANGAIWRGEFKNKAKDGSYYWVDTTIVPFLDANGKPYQYVAIRSDITARKLGQEKLLEQERFIKTITDNLPAMISYWTADLKCLFANKPYLEWFEKTPQEMTSINKQDLLGEEEFKQNDPYVKNVLKGEPQSFERIFHKNGDKTIYVQTQYMPDREGNRIKGFFSLIYDVSEVKIAEKKEANKKIENISLKSLKEKSIILESIDDAFFAVNNNWVITYINNKALSILGKTKNETIDCNLWEVFPESLDTEAFPNAYQAMKIHNVVQFEFFFPPVSMWLEASIYPSDTGLSVYFKDITERKKTEQELKKLNENLQKYIKGLEISNEELEQFAYVASHDLQEPLRMVTSFLTLIENKYEGIIDEKGKQYINFAVDGAKRMREIILDLLEYSRIGKIEVNLEEVNLNKLINEILPLYRKQINDANARVTFDNLPTLLTYKTPIRQILTNLIGNSLKYHKQGEAPIISISCSETANEWQISVKDNGIGIKAEYLDKIFILFKRLHNRVEYPGTGMGLAIVKKIAENLGGKVWAESEEGKGSAFYFTILKKQ